MNVTSVTKQTYLALYELFGGVINQARINYVTSMLCSYAATWHTRVTQGYSCNDVRLDLTIARLLQCPVTFPRLILHPPRIGELTHTRPGKSGTYLDLHVGGVRQRAALVSTLLILKDLLEPLRSEQTYHEETTTTTVYKNY